MTNYLRCFSVGFLEGCKPNACSLDSQLPQTSHCSTETYPNESSTAESNNSSDSEDDPPPLFERMKQLTGSTSGKMEHTKCTTAVKGTSLHTRKSPQAVGAGCTFEVQVLTNSNEDVKEGANSYKARDQLTTSSRNFSCCPKRKHTSHELIEDNAKKLSEDWQTYFDEVCHVASEPLPHPQPMSHQNNLVKDVCDYRGHSEEVSSNTGKTNVHINSPQELYEASSLGGTAACPIVLD